jgi:hypothetical protein
MYSPRGADWLTHVGTNQTNTNDTPTTAILVRTGALLTMRAIVIECAACRCDLSHELL